MGNEISNRAMAKREKDDSHRIIVTTELGQSVTMAEKSDILIPITADEDQTNMQFQLHASVLALFQDVMKSIGA